MAVTTATENRPSTAFAGAWVNIIIGIIVIAVPFFTLESEAAFWNNVIVGVLVIALAAYTAYATASRHAGSAVWSAGANVILGLWLIAYPFFVDVGMGYFWANVILGLVLVLVAGYNAWAASNTGRVAGRRAQA